MITTKDLIRKSAIYYADRPAAVFERRTLSYREVNERANRLANTLSGLGLRQGSRVATLRGNGLHFIEVVFGVISGLRTAKNDVRL
jgi:acyl-CoA synthetase (AMP-forming)/AMP-acid ligase II